MFPGWMIVRLRPNQGRRAVENMERQHFEVYVPRAVMRNQRGLRTVQPLFPGYAFVRHPSDRWVSLRGTFGVLDVLLSPDLDGDGNPAPAALPDAEVVRLRAREGPDGLIRLESREFALGEHVHVEGVFLGDAVVDGMSGPDRVFVLMQMMGRWTRVEVGVEDLHK